MASHFDDSTRYIVVLDVSRFFMSIERIRLLDNSITLYNISSQNHLCRHVRVSTRQLSYTNSS